MQIISSISLGPIATVSKRIARDRDATHQGDDIFETGCSGRNHAKRSCTGPNAYRLSVRRRHAFSDREANRE